MKLKKIKCKVVENVTEEELFEFQTFLERLFVCVERSYEVLKGCVQYIADFHTSRAKLTLLQRVSDMMAYLSHRVCGIGVKTFDRNEEFENLRKLKQSYAASVYISITRVSASSSARMEAALQEELLTKQEELRALEEQDRERVRLVALEVEREQKNLDLDLAMDSHRRKLGLMQVRQEVNKAEARCRAAASIRDDGGSLISVPNINVVHSQPEIALNPSAPVFKVDNKNEPHGARVVNNDQPRNGVSLAQTLANAMEKSRLPVPTPAVFSDNPIDFHLRGGSKH